VIEQVVKQYREMETVLEQTLARARAADKTLKRNIRQSEENLTSLDGEAHAAAGRNSFMASDLLHHDGGVGHFGWDVTTLGRHRRCPGVAAAAIF